mgnify:CR=1 FL=1
MGILVAQTTKRALEASLKKLLLKKPLNKITINDITEDCGVNRMTFYYHFKDIYDLVDWILVEDAAEALEGRQNFETWTFCSKFRRISCWFSMFTAPSAGNRWSSTSIKCLTLCCGCL